MKHYARKHNPKFSGDFGSWDRGQVVEFRAADREAAIDKGLKIAKELGVEMVQLGEMRKDGTRELFYDYVNGRLA